MAEPRHEHRDIEVGLLARLGLVLVGITAIVVLAVLMLFRGIVAREAAREEPRSPLSATPSGFIGPRLQVDPPAVLQEQLSAEREHLSSYGWIDRDAGVVHIPIDRALELVVARGVPLRVGARR